MTVLICPVITLFELGGTAAGSFVQGSFTTSSN
jgi:hypothetical protein